MKSPFKFLDSYTREDRSIFFGRDREIEELYHRVFESKIMLVYGISGTGKSSLIHCGLANKFQDTDWLPIVVRRGSNIIKSLTSGINAASITEKHSDLNTPASFRKAVRSLYLDHYKPVFFIFDQFEELFIFGSKEERKSLIQIVKLLTESDLQCRMIFVMREEYMAGVTEFEKYIPTFFSNRVRIENMSHSNAIEAIEKPCEVAGIKLEEGFAEALLERLSPEAEDVELTYLQVYLDRLFKSSSSEENNQTNVFGKDLLDKAGNVSDLLGDFLDEQVSLLKNPESGLAILKTFVSLKGTRKQINEDEIRELAGSFGKSLDSDSIVEYLQQFTSLRILKEMNDGGRYELRHDILAEKIFNKISLMERELLEVISFLETACNQYEKRGVFLSEADLNYIRYFDDKQVFKSNSRFSELINSSKSFHSKARRKRRQVAAFLGIGIIVILSILSVWAISQRNKAILQRNEAENARNETLVAKDNAEKARSEAELQRTRAEESEKVAREEEFKAMNAKITAETELYRNIKNSLTVSIEKNRVLYSGVENPVSVTVSGIPSDKLKVFVSDNSKIKGENGRYLIIPEIADSATVMENIELPDGQILPISVSFDTAFVCRITVCAVLKNGSFDTIGYQNFELKEVPDPQIMFAGNYGGQLNKDSILKYIPVFGMPALTIPEDNYIWQDFKIKSFTMIMTHGGYDYSSSSTSATMTDAQLELFRKLTIGDLLIFQNISVIRPDNKIRYLKRLIFKIY